MPLPQPPSMDDAQDDASLDSFEGDVQEEQFDREALEDKVGEMLAKLDDDDAVDPDDIEEDEDDEDDADEGDEGDEEADDLDENEDEDESDNEEDEESEAAADLVELDENAPTLPDAFRRSLVAYGYTDAEINRDLNKHGPAFVATAAGIHSQRNQELAAWSQAGRAAKAGNTDQVHPANNQAAELQKLDVDALKAEFGDDAMIDQIAARINPIIDRVSQMVPNVEKVQAEATEAANAQLRKTVEGFFTDEALASRYGDVYGTGNATLNEPQLLNRQRVLEEADALMTGAKLQGRNLTVEQALQNAHDMVSHEFVQQATRKSIKKEAKSRNRGITQKPSNRGKSKTKKYDGPARTREELYDRTEQRLKAVFGN